VLESSERGQAQRAYKVQVATSRELLRADRPDVWDSGKVASPESIGVVYDGPPLESATRYYWRVRAWDADGHPSRWSDPAWSPPTRAADLSPTGTIRRSPAHGTPDLDRYAAHRRAGRGVRARRGRWSRAIARPARQAVT
jgi:hypothetical protein